MKAINKGFWMILALMLVTGGALALIASQATAVPPPRVGPSPQGDDLVSVTAALAQAKVLMGSDGEVAVSLQLEAAALPRMGDTPDVPVDMVVVLDRSGSMNGAKIEAARSAIVQLVNRLTARDQLALVTYANDVRTDAPLLTMDAGQRHLLVNTVHAIRAAGGTNLGGGLQQGLNLLADTPAAGRQRKVILISDGLANQGITNPVELGRMASAAMEWGFSVSSVGVGYDFNEMLMTTLADHGAGRYYFLENPLAFARVFEEEFQTARRVVAAGMQVRVPLQNGVRLVHAGGYPITYQDRYAVFYPGQLLSGQQRSLFLTFAVPTNREHEVSIDALQVRYQYQGLEKTLHADLGLKVACVIDPAKVAASVDKETWSRQVLQEDYSRLKTAIADAIRKGERQVAMEEIQAYETRTRALNSTVGSAAVQDNIDEDVQQLREKVEETFAGAPAVVEVKRKQQAKSLQYDGYKIRRDKK